MLIVAGQPTCGRVREREEGVHLLLAYRAAGTDGDRRARLETHEVRERHGRESVELKLLTTRPHRPSNDTRTRNKVGNSLEGRVALVEAVDHVVELRAHRTSEEASL